MRIASVRRSPTAGPSRSRLERIALGAEIGGALIATGGIAVVVSLAGSVEAGSVISYLCWLGGVGVLALRPRGAAVASATLDAVILALLVNQPYATGSLLNPGANVGHFAGVLVVLVCALLGFGASCLAAARGNRVTGSER